MIIVRESDAWPELPTLLAGEPCAWGAQGLRALRVDVPEDARAKVLVLRIEHLFRLCDHHEAVLATHVQGPQPSARALEPLLTVWEWRSSSPVYDLRGPLLIVAQVEPPEARLRVRAIQRP